MASSEKSSEKPKQPRRAGVGTVLSLLIVAFGVYYFVHVQRKTAYYAARNLRILSTVATQIVDRIETRAFTPSAAPPPAQLVWDPSSGSFAEVLAASSGSSRPDAPAPPKPRRIMLDQVVRQVFEQSFVNVFDGVMIADEQGNVRWQQPRNVSSASHLGDLTAIKGFGRTEVALKMADLQNRAFTGSVLLEGREFRLFSQPLPMQKGDGTSSSWVVAGVVANNRFAAESLTISYTLLILVLAVFLLIIFSLPFLKLRLLGEMQRVRVTDIIMLGVALLCAIAVVTLICLDAIAYRYARQTADEQLRRLGSDIKRHLTTEIGLAYAALAELDASLFVPRAESVNAVLPQGTWGAPAVTRYPFFESFSRIDANGMQRQKWYTTKTALEPIPVANRAYFQEALRGEGWLPRNAQGHYMSRERYVLEPIRSRTTGVTQAVIARRAANPKDARHKVVALAFPMLSLIDTVIAGDCKFVIIDEEGRVVFHSEAERNNVENFFTETDKDRTLRAAVAGRQNEMVNLRYWGEDQRAFVTPVGGTPWTLVTFRSKRLLRTLNVETIMIAVMFLLIHALGYALFAALVALGRPSYRAPWLWPNHRRGTDYLCLIGSYAALSIAFAASIYLFRPRVVLAVAALIPALALLLTYLRLRDDSRRITGGFAEILTAGAAAMLGACVVLGQTETDILPSAALVRLFIVCALAAGIYVARFHRVKRDEAEPEKNPQGRLIMPGYSYVIGATGLLLLSAVFPTAALYKAAYKIEMESFVKHGQLRLVQDLEAHFRRIDAAHDDKSPAAAVTDELKKSNLGIYYRFFFDTEVYLRRDDAGDDDRFMTTVTGVDVPLDTPNQVPRFVEWLLPQYSDHSIRMRELLHSASADKQWRWRRRGEQLDFHSDSISGMRMVTISEIPRLVARPGRRSGFALDMQTPISHDEPRWGDVTWDTDAMTYIGGGLLLIAVLAGYLTLIVYGAYFVSRKVFLVDILDPLWLKPTGRISPALGGNILIFAPPELNVGDVVLDRRGLFIELSLAPFDDRYTDVTQVWHRELTRVDREQPGKGVFIPDFDRGTGNPAFMELKLRLLESLIHVHTRSVVAVTHLSPWVLLDAVSQQPELAARWRTLLTTFTVRIEEGKKKEEPEFTEKRLTDGETKLLTGTAAATAEPRQEPAAVPPATTTLPAPMAWAADRVVGFFRSDDVRKMLNGSPQHAQVLIDEETAAHGPYLQRLGEELRDRLRGREEIYDEIGERAAMYYASLWVTCTNAEKAVLLHIAADGFANSKDRHTIRRLLARGLIRRAPNFKVMNETFRRFVIADAQKREVEAFYKSDVPQSAWDKIQKPLMVGLVLAGGFFFFTQRELFDASFAIVSGVAGGIPAVLRLVGIFTAPREAIASTR